MIKIQNLNKTYLEAGRELHIFDDLNIEIPDSSRNILLGASGSGKSTFLNLISGLDDADSGSIEINGIKLTNLDQNEKTIFRREKLGFIFQFFNLIPTLNLEENIFLPLELNRINTKENQDYVKNLLDRVGLIDRLKSMPDTLSGGEQQRVAIVRALAHKPSLIVADEPTGNLDKETASKIMLLLDELLKESKAILVMATHDESLKSLADNVYELKNKSLVRN